VGSVFIPTKTTARFDLSRNKVVGFNDMRVTAITDATPKNERVLSADRPDSQQSSKPFTGKIVSAWRKFNRLHVDSFLINVNGAGAVTPAPFIIAPILGDT